MKIEKHSVEVNPDTFAPELKLFVSISIEPIMDNIAFNGVTDELCLKLGKEFLEQLQIIMDKNNG